MFTDIIAKIAIGAVPILFSVIIHEVAHGWMAHRLGDNTAKNMGRLTLNPLPHIDPIGTILLPFTMIVLKTGLIFGWAKPVPFNPYNFRRDVNVRTGTMWVGLAGPLSNFILAFVASFAFVALHGLSSSLPPFVYYSIRQLAGILIQINVSLGLLNLIPLPPLDGSKILMRFLPEKYVSQYLMIERYGFMILIFLLATGVYSKIMIVPYYFFLKLFLFIPSKIFSLFS